MKCKAFLPTLVLIGSGCIALAQKPSSVKTLDGQMFAFVNVNVLPMDREEVLVDQTVIIRNGRVAEVGPSKTVTVPAGALRIDARGQYLIPGLVEMHGHFPRPDWGERTTESFLKLFVANGVTTVRAMYGYENSIRMRDRVARGEIPGPTLFVACPALSGEVAKTPEDGERLVRQYKKAGYDLLKIHEGLSRDTYNRIVITAREIGIPFGGHVPNDVGVEEAMKAGQCSIDHMDGFVQALEADDSPVRNADPDIHNRKWFEYLDESKIPKLAKEARDAGVWVIPTLDLWKTLFGVEPLDVLVTRPELVYIPPRMLDEWINEQRNVLSILNPAAGRPMIGMRDKMLKSLWDAGANIALGSDAPQRFSVPGFSLIREMKAMVRAGLTPFQVLQSGTYNAARYFNATGEFGIVRMGARADLILLKENPLKDVSNVSSPSGVMARGIWMPENEIRQMLDGLVQLRD